MGVKFDFMLKSSKKCFPKHEVIKPCKFKSRFHDFSKDGAQVKIQEMLKTEMHIQTSNCNHNSSNTDNLYSIYNAITAVILK